MDKRLCSLQQYAASNELGKPEVEKYLTYLAVERNVSASTQNQALSAILYLYKALL